MLLKSLSPFWLQVARSWLAVCSPWKLLRILSLFPVTWCRYFFSLWAWALWPTCWRLVFFTYVSVSISFFLINFSPLTKRSEKMIYFSSHCNKNTQTWRLEGFSEIFPPLHSYRKDLAGLGDLIYSWYCDCCFSQWMSQSVSWTGTVCLSFYYFWRGEGNSNLTRYLFVGC